MSRPPTDPHIMIRHSLRAIAGALGALVLTLGCARAEFGAAGAEQAKQRWCAEIGARLHSVSGKFCARSGLMPSGLTSVDGRALMVLDRRPTPPRRSASNDPATRAPRIMMIGGIHGDELTSVSIVFRWMEMLDRDHAGDIHWRIVPAANPDGLLTRPSRRMNARGVDLNRNFDTPDWSAKAMDYWVRRTREDPRRFPGESPVSEPETLWLQQQIETFRPDAIVSIHAPYGVLDFDGPAEEPKRFGRLRLNRLGVYPGSLGNYGGVYKGVPVITIELPNATRMPSEGEQEAIWRDMLDWLRTHIVPANLS